MSVTYKEIEQQALKITCLFVGHQWEFQGGRPCPKGIADCSEPVEKCLRCGEYNFESPHEYCKENCHEL